MVNFYGKDNPKVGDLIVCRIDSIGENSGGYWVELLEYGNKAGFVGLKEITQAKWFRNLRGLAHEGDIEVMQVISIGDHGDIDLSRRYINEKSRETILNRYKMWKRVYDYLDHMVDEIHKEVVIGNILHPYLHCVLDEQTRDETGNDETRDEDMSHDETEDDETKSENQDDQDDQDNDETIHEEKKQRSLSEWLKNNATISSFLEEDLQKSVLENITRLLEKPVECRQQNGHLRLEKLSRLKITELNNALDVIRNKFPVKIMTYSTKTCTFQISSKEKMSQIDFINLLEEILKFSESITVSALPSSSTPSSTPSSTLSSTSLSTASTQSDQPLLNIGIVGHVAHGKTTLIEAISGIDTRRYKSEVATNRTLNIGYTNVTVCKCTCDDEKVPVYLAKKDTPPSCQCERIAVSVVDCPGHNVLLSTMITGAHIMDTCILVVAADEQCPQPQTNEHVAVLQIIGSSEAHFSDGMIIQNKVDLINDERIDSSAQEIKNFVKGTVFEKAPIIPISAQLSLNVHHILRFIFEYARYYEEKKRTKTIETRLGHPKGIIVRTFDINKPGSEKVKGAVIGGSIIKGEFAVGETIILVPLCIEATILSMKTENTDLSRVHEGGLIAIQTDINPTFCNMLTGCAFVKKQDYDPSRFLKADSLVKCKYNLLTDCGLDRIPKDTHLTINYAGCNTEVVVVKSAHDKHRMVVKTLKPMYVFPEENFTFTMVANKRLIGFARGLDFAKIPLPVGDVNIVSFPEYPQVLQEFREALQEWKEKSAEKLRLPVPRTQYKNTFTTIVNFDNLCNALGVSLEDFGKYICQELGLKSHSINGLKQLVLKGRTDEKRVISVLHRYIQDKRCILCRRNTIKIVRNMGVKQKVCTHCSWKGSQFN